MPRSKLSIPLALGQSFSVAAATKHGVAQSQLQHPLLESPFHGIRMLPNTDDEQAADRVASTRRLAGAYSHRLRDNEFFSHETAALLHGAPLPFSLMTELHVTIFRPGRSSKARGVRSHSATTSSATVTTVDELPVSSPATTWAMLGESLDVSWLVAVGDYFCRVWRREGYYRPNAGRKPLATPDKLADALSATRRTGAAKLREALPLIRFDSWSPMESLTRYHLVTNGLPEPQLNVDAFDRYGVHLGCIDMSFPKLKVAIEYQGQAHGHQYAKDIERVERLRAEGWIVIQVSSELIRDPETLARRVRDALLSRGWRG
ncbi:DUF559 domain-containing protein [Paramicrobacterium fandaimingii]|uniref:DUF559 domain-containing protein n=1 Tax=Paramicrobacterium fandaimingii TaxID=2708079 RepID=UPI00141EB66D|nr:DUF559 domain-containing protein [Microbacterium fandaimingii]